jgi:hypothetical protein
MFLIPASSYRIKTTKHKGRGVFAMRDLPTGTVIGDYLGTIIRPYTNDEKKNGLYDMQGGLHYDIMGDRTKIGIPLINHACANNCELYPYRGGHVLYVALRKIFKGEELTVNYGIGVQDEKDIPCSLHVCRCGSKICTGTMHTAEDNFEAWYRHWESLLKKNFGAWYGKVPGKYGAQLAPLGSYPDFIDVQKVKLYDPSIFGSEMLPVAVYKDEVLPRLPELKKLIRETGRRLSFPKLHLVIDGVRSNILLAERK